MTQPIHIRPVERDDLALWERMRYALWPSESREELAGEIEAFFGEKAIPFPTLHH